MLMTEEEATTRACCNGAKRPADNGPCIGSRCMAWRWDRFSSADKIAQIRRYREETNASLKEAMDWWNGRSISDGRSGFCGLAGKPDA